MTAAGVQTVRSASIRTALAATAVVAIVYLAIAASVVAITTQNLTGQVDSRLVDAFSHITKGPGPGGPPQGGQVAK